MKDEENILRVLNEENKMEEFGMVECPVENIEETEVERVMRNIKDGKPPGSIDVGIDMLNQGKVSRK